MVGVPALALEKLKKMRDITIISWFYKWIGKPFGS
jgi:hypothetical protein